MGKPSVPNLARAAQQRAAEIEDATIVEENAQDFSSSESLLKILTEAGTSIDGATVHVYLIEKDSGDEPKIWKGTTDDYDLDALAKKFGSGKYRVKVYGPHPASGKYGVLMNQVVPYRLTPDEDSRIRALREGRNLDVPPAMTPDAIRAMVVEAVRAAQPAAPAVNPLAMMRDMAEVFRAMQPPQVAPATPAMNPLEIVKAVAGIARDLNVDREPIERGVNATGSDIMMKLIEKFAPLFTDVLAKQQATNGVGSQPASLSAPANPAAQPAALSQEDQIVLRLKMGLAFLIEQAKADADPDVYGAVVVDNVPATELKAMLDAPDWIERLSAFEPRVKDFAKWFEELKTAVQEEIAEREREKPGPETV